MCVVGGSSAVSPAVLDDLERVLRDTAAAPGFVLQRVSGADRYFTAAASAGVVGGSSVGNYTPARTAFLSTGLTPADSLSAGPIAYRSNFPVLLTRPGSVPAATLAALQRDRITNIILLGGTTAVSDAVVAQLARVGRTVTRVAGADRYATNAALYRLAAAPVGGTEADPRGGLGYPKPTTALLTIGDVFADALSAGPLAAEGTKANPIGRAVAAGSPLLMSSWYDVPPATTAYLSENQETISTVTALGLDWAMPESVVQSARIAAKAG